MNDERSDHEQDGARQNRLASETSPYLRQHRHNPVDWYPWGDEAFARARAEDRPVLLSVGYSACHWCHVMAHESFEDPVTAELMNRVFVNVKVDREERPDVDAIYMQAVQAMTGAGGWPMTVAMLPDGRPFFGGTYFPPEERFGRPSFRRVIEALEDAWRNRRDEVEASAEEMHGLLVRMTDLPPAPGEPSAETLQTALRSLMSTFDARHGGFGGAPKFPPHAVLGWLLERPEPAARKMAEETLEGMRRGGIFDGLGGGFARYSTDERWLVPHFEKMLYDNAQLAERYARAFALTGNDAYRRTARMTLEWILREMTSPEGGFYSALDADTEGEEGRFYVWSDVEFGALLGDDAPLARAAFGVSEPGNFEGRNVLHERMDAMSLAERFGRSDEDVRDALERVRRILFEAREARERPGLDDKVLASWNALATSAFAAAYRVFGDERYLGAALRNARFVEERLTVDGRLRHTYKNGVARVEGLLEDYALTGLALVELYRATCDGHWLERAFVHAETIVARFRDERNGGFYSTADDAEALVVRPKNPFDTALPSDVGSAALLLVTLARYAGRSDWETLALDALRPMRETMERQPTGFGTMLLALERVLAPPREIAIFGDAGAADTRALLGRVERHAPPFAVVALAHDESDPLAERLPFLRGRGRLDGRATAYVCEAGACRLPTTDPEELERLLRDVTLAGSG